MEAIDEKFLESRMVRNAEEFTKKFPAQMEALESSPLARVRSITPYDQWALGEQFVQWENYRRFMVSEAGSSGDLGKLPQVALDLITAVYGSSIVPVVCSVQPIEEERGIIYYKQTKAGTTRGNVTSGQVLRQPFAPPDVYHQGFAGENVQVTLGTTDGTTKSYSGTLATGYFPVRPNSFRIVVGTGATQTIGMDDGGGYILGQSFQGVIDYTLGTWTLEWSTAPTTAQAIVATYGTYFEDTGTNVPKINFITASTDIQAEIFALQSEIGMFKAFSMQKRFGKAAEDEMVSDLTNEMNAALGVAAIVRLQNAAPAAGALSWDKIPGASTPWALHKLELKDKISQADATIFNNSGRGQVNLLIAGTAACGILSNMPGFERSGINANGPHVYGTLDGLPIIRSVTGVTTTNRIYCVYKGPGNFDAPEVYSPYMPLFINAAIPTPSNIMKKTGLAAIWAGLKVVAANYVTYLDIQNLG